MQRAGRPGKSMKNSSQEMTGAPASRRRRILKTAATLAGIVAGAYVAVIALLYTYQRNILYMAHVEPVGAPSEYGVTDMHDVGIRTQDGLTLHDWFKPPAEKDGYVLVVFHGSYANIRDMAILKPIIPTGKFGILFCEYRGFGASPGQPTEEGVYADARAAVKWLNDQGYDDKHLIFFGGSLGAAIAIQMALEAKPPLLILMSPFSSIAETVKAHFSLAPAETLLEDRFDNMSKIARIHSPVLFVHGDDDAVVPIELSRRLFALANQPKEFLTVHGAGHCNLMGFTQVYKTIADWAYRQLNLVSK